MLSHVYAPLLKLDTLHTAQNVLFSRSKIDIAQCFDWIQKQQLPVLSIFLSALKDTLYLGLGFRCKRRYVHFASPKVDIIVRMQFHICCT